MARFVFVSGSETSCDAWNLVLDGLRELGHACCSHGLGEISWTDDIEAGIQALADRIGRVNETILVGHSWVVSSVLGRGARRNERGLYRGTHTTPRKICV